MGAEVADQPWSFEEFFATEDARLVGGLCLVTGDRHEADEIMQDAFPQPWERWDRVARIEDPTAHSFRTTMNVSEAVLRRSDRVSRLTRPWRNEALR